MINFEQLGRQIAEDILREGSPDVGPCFYPGKFKPPHKGHFEATKYLASLNYINKVTRTWFLSYNVFSSNISFVVSKRFTVFLLIPFMNYF
jgi:hypothetical protein